MRIEHGEEVRQYGIDRVCRAPACTARLSRYNPEEYCRVHVRQRFEALQERSELPGRFPAIVLDLVAELRRAGDPARGGG